MSPVAQGSLSNPGPTIFGVSGREVAPVYSEQRQEHVAWPSPSFTSSTSFTSLTSLFPKLSPPNPHLNRVDSRIRAGNPRIRDVHEPHFRRPVVFLAQNMRAQRPARSEIHVRSPLRHFGIGEQRPTFNLKEGLHFFRRRHNPFERKRIHARSVSRIRALYNHPHRHRIHCVLQLPVQKA